MRRAACVVLLGLAACGKRAHDEQAEPPAPLDPSTIYPLIVRASDLPTGPVRRPLVDGLVVTLAAAQPVAGGQTGAAGGGEAGAAGGGQAKLLREPDLQGMALDAAYTTALANLEAAARRGEIPLRAEKEDGQPVDIVWGHDWRAAACLLLPGARQQAMVAFTPVEGPARARTAVSASAPAVGSASAPAVGSASAPGAGSASAQGAGSASAPGVGSASAPTVYAAIPNRDVLIFFADPAVAKAALAAEPGGPRPLTDQILRVLPTDQPFWFQAPVSPAN